MSPDFSVWCKAVWRLTAYAILASLLGTGLVAMTLAVAQAALTGGSGVADIGPVTVDLPDATVLVLVLAAVLLTVSSVVQSWLRKVDAILVRRRLTDVSRAATVPLPTRSLMSERFLMEGWTHWITAVVQAAGFSVLLVWAGGVGAIAGVAAAAVIGTLVGRRFFARAVNASQAFLSAQKEATSMQKEAADDPALAAQVPAALDRVTEAVYRRDNEAFRLSTGAMALLSIGIIGAAIIPALVAVPAASLPLYLIVLLMWRQRAIDAVTTVGMLAWTLTVWRDAAATATSTLDETGFTEVD